MQGLRNTRYGHRDPAVQGCQRREQGGRSTDLPWRSSRTAALPNEHPPGRALFPVTFRLLQCTSVELSPQGATYPRVRPPVSEPVEEPKQVLLSFFRALLCRLGQLSAVSVVRSHFIPWTTDLRCPGATRSRSGAMFPVVLQCGGLCAKIMRLLARRVLPRARFFE